MLREEGHLRSVNKPNHSNKRRTSFISKERRLQYEPLFLIARFEKLNKNAAYLNPILKF